MAKLALKAGTTSYIAQIFIQDSSSTTGAGLTALTSGSSGLTAYYHRDTDTTATVISLTTMTLGTYTSTGFLKIDDSNMPGCYQFGIPNAVIAAGAKSVLIMFKGATNMAPLPLEIELTAVDNQSATAFMTSVASVVGAVGSVTGLTASNLDTTVSSRMATYTQPTGFLAATFPAGTVANTTNLTAGTITTVTNLTNAPTAGDLTATMKTSVTTAATAATPIAASVTGAVGSVTGNVGGNIIGTVASVVGSVGSVTGNVGGSVASVTGNLGGNVVGTVASVVDLSTTTLAESSAVPAATDTLKNKLNYVATMTRNKLTETATAQLLRNDADSATIATATVSDDGTTFIRGKFA